MQIYKAETDEIIKRFRSNKLTRDQCIMGLYDALSSALPDFGPEDLPMVRAIMTANDEAIRAETARRRQQSGTELSPYTN